MDTDDRPVGRALQRAGIMNNLDLSSRRAGNVVAYLASQGVDPGIMSAKGFGDTHPVAQKRHCGGTGTEPSRRNRAGGARRLTPASRRNWRPVQERPPPVSRVRQQLEQPAGFRWHYP